MSLFRLPVDSTPRRVTSAPGEATSGVYYDLIWVVVFFLFVLVVENILVGLWAVTLNGVAAPEGRTFTAYGVYSIAMLCSGAASFVGGLIGFLFGVPQSNADRESATRIVEAAQRDNRQVDQPGEDEHSETTPAASGMATTERETSRGSGLRRNTNLENVSDALTKGLLAIGLTQLSNIGEWADGVGSTLGASLGPGTDGKVVALTVLTYGTVAGFLFGYLATRIYLTGVFERYDPR
jgi:hypothetical protein